MHQQRRVFRVGHNRFHPLPVSGPRGPQQPFQSLNNNRFSRPQIDNNNNQFGQPQINNNERPFRPSQPQGSPRRPNAAPIANSALPQRPQQVRQTAVRPPHLFVRPNIDYLGQTFGLNPIVVTGEEEFSPIIKNRKKNKVTHMGRILPPLSLYCKL